MPGLPQHIASVVHITAQQRTIADDHTLMETSPMALHWTPFDLSLCKICIDIIKDEKKRKDVARHHSRKQRDAESDADGIPRNETT